MKKTIFLFFIVFCFSDVIQAQIYFRNKGTTISTFADSVLFYYRSLDKTEYSIAHPPLEVKIGNTEFGKSIVILLQKNKHVPYGHILYPVGNSQYVLLTLEGYNHNSLEPVEVISVFTEDADLDGIKELFIINYQGGGTKRFYTQVISQDEDHLGKKLQFSKMSYLEGYSVELNFEELKNSTDVKLKLKEYQLKAGLNK